MYFRNLWLSICAIFHSKTFRELLLNIDRMGNAVCSGDYRFTVSARVGYFVTHRANWYWRLLEWAINNAFYPIDGSNHCFEAYRWEKNYLKISQDKEYRRSNDVALFGLSIVVMISCLILAPIIWILSLFMKPY